MNETNTAAMGGIRGLGMVTGEAGGGQTGMNDAWINQNGAESQQNTNLHQSLVNDHNDLHDEIESNDVSPKSGKKLRIVSTR